VFYVSIETKIPSALQKGFFINFAKKKMTIERVLENPHVTISKCKPFQKPDGEIYYPYKYTLTYCYHSWNHSRQIHTNDLPDALIKMLTNLKDERIYGLENGIPLEEIQAQINNLVEPRNNLYLRNNQESPWKDLVEMLEKGPWK
jgi:hypothetical protein